MIKKKIKVAAVMTAWIGIIMFIVSFLVALLLGRNLEEFYFSKSYMFYEIFLVLFVVFFITFIFYKKEDK